MEINTLQKELTDLYRMTMDYEFQLTTYDDRMGYLKQAYAELLAETARVCEASEEDMESLAACIPEYVAGRLALEPSKRKRDIKSLDYKMNMVSYFVPLMGGSSQK